MSSIIFDNVFTGIPGSGAGSSFSRLASPGAGNIPLNSLILAVIVLNGTTNVVTSVTDDRGQTWNKLKSVSSPDNINQIQVWETVSTGVWGGATPLNLTVNLSAPASIDVAVAWITGVANGNTPSQRQKIINLALEAGSTGSPTPPQVVNEGGDPLIAVAIASGIRANDFQSDVNWGGGGGSQKWRTGTTSTGWGAMIQWATAFNGGSSPPIWAPGLPVPAQHASMVLAFGDPRKALVA